MASAPGSTPLLLAVLACYRWGCAAARVTEGGLTDAGGAKVGGDHIMLQVGHTGRIESMLQVSDNATQRPSCCPGCAGHSYCSPISNNCYEEQYKEYYRACPTQARGSSTCCGGCAGRNYCSPVSGSCYDGRDKPYYAPCSGDANPGRSALQACRGPGNMRVKMLTYNLFWWSLFEARGGNGGSAGKLVSNAAHGEPFDVAGFQECDNPDWIMGDAGMHEEYDYVRWGSNTIAFRKSRWEKRANGHEFTAEDRSDQHYGRRGVQWIRLHDTASNGTLFFIHTHGPLPVNTGGRYGGEAAAHGILGVISRQAGPDDNIVLTGDFNADASSSTVLLLQEQIHRIMTVWVDHIFTNCDSGVIETRNLGKGGSDHDALMGVFEF